MIRFLQQDSRIIKVIFVGLIAVVGILMVITLVPGIFQDAGTGGGDNFASVRNDGRLGRYIGGSTTIPMTQVRQMAQRMQQERHYPDMLVPYLMQQAGQNLVMRAVLLEEADHLGLRVSDSDVRGELMHGPLGAILFPNGKFIGQSRYEDFVQNEFGMSTSDFEKEVKNDVLISRLQALVTGGVAVSDGEVRAAYLKKATKVKFQYAVLSAEDLRQQIRPSDAELEAYFKKNSAQYANAVPETRTLRYIAFSLDQIPGGPPQVSGADVQRYYNQHQQQFKVPEQVEVRHILIAVPQKADAKTVAAAKAKAEDILNQLHHGGNFAELAKKYSDDPGSRAQGGELGFIQHGATVPEFDRTAFSLAPGQTSGVIRTQFGFHILQVQAKKPAHVKPVDAVHDVILADLTQQAKAKAAEAFASKLKGEAVAGGLDKAAAENHLKVVTTAPLQKGSVIPGLADGTQLLTRAFASTAGAAPDSASTGDGYAIFTVQKVTPAHAPTFDTWKSHVLDDFRDQAIPGLMRSRTQQLAIKAKEDGSLEKAAKQVGAKLETSDLVSSDDQVPDLGAMATTGAEAFTLNKGQISGPIVTPRTGVVLQILDKQAPTDAEIDQNMDSTRDQLVQQRRNTAFAVFATSLEEHFIKRGLIHYNQGALSRSNSGV